MKVLIVGSRGFIGAHLLRKLKQRDDIEVAEASSQDGAFDASGLLSSTFAVPSGTQTVVYLAQSPFYRQMPERADHLLNVNLVSAVRLAELSRCAGVGRFIYASTGSVYAPSFQPLAETAPLRRDGWYAWSKVAAEEALALVRKDLDVTIVRPFGVYGPGQSKMLVARLIESVEAEQEMTLDRRAGNPDDGDGLRISLCYVDDAVAILETLLDRAGPPVLNLAGLEPVSIRQLATEIARQLGKQPRLRLVDRNREGDLIADASLLRATFTRGFTSLAEGIRQTIESKFATACRTE